MSGQHSVEKIGGTSMAATAVLFDNVLIAGRKGADLYNRVFVVSAYAGMTDLLLEHKKSGEPGVYARFVADDGADGWRHAIETVRTAMHGRNADMFARAESLAEANAFVDARIDAVAACLDDLARLRSHGRFCVKEQLVTVRELLAGLGEAHSAHSTALLLRDRGVNACFVDLTLWDQQDMRGLDERIEQAFAPIDLATTLPIVTGYAGCSEGMVRRYARGYSEMTFSRIAVLTQAREAIIHKEFHLSSADPKLVGTDKARKIGRTNYDVADQLANLGMEAIHPRAAKGLRQDNIPLRVKNTFEPEHGGTLIDGEYTSERPCVEIIAGRKQVYALEVFDQDMVGSLWDYEQKILSAISRFKATVITKDINANTITHYLGTNLKTVKRIVNAVNDEFTTAEVSTRKVAIVSAIGSDMKVPGMLAKTVSALASADISVLAMHQSMRQVDMQFVINEDDYEAAVANLHRCLVEVHDHGEAICVA